MSVEASSAVVASALCSVVKAFGPDVATDARRVRACLTDELGAEARARRAEVDAVVVAAEEGVADRLRGVGFDRDEALAVLGERGLSDEVAAYAIDAWRHGLGLSGPLSVAPVLSSVVGAAAIADEVTDPAISIDVPGVGPGPHIVANTDLPGQTVLPGETPPAGKNAGSRLVLSIAAAVIIIGGAVGGYFIFNGGSTDKASGIRTSDTKPLVIHQDFPVERLDWGPRLNKTWTAGGGKVHGQLSFSNSTDAPMTGRYIEVIPKDLASSASMVKATPAPSEVIKDDPILAFDVTVPANGNAQVTYDIVAANVTAKKLSSWKESQMSDLMAYQASTATTTTTTTTMPMATTLPSAIATPTSPVIVTPTPTTPSPKQTKPTTRPTTPPVTSPPATLPPVTSPPVTAPVVTSPTNTTPTSNQSPHTNPAYANPTSTPLTGAYAYWDIWLKTDAFIDPENDTWVLYSAGNGQYGTAQIVDCATGGVHKCVRYTRSAATVGITYCYDDEISVRAYDPSGSDYTSDLLRLTIHVRPGAC